MNAVVFDRYTRRVSLLTLGAAGLTAAFASPFASGARKKHGKKKRNNGDVNKLCKKQVGQCIDVLTASCDDDPECLADVERCCPLLGKCDFAGLFACGEGDNSMRRLTNPRSKS